MEQKKKGRDMDSDPGQFLWIKDKAQLQERQLWGCVQVVGNGYQPLFLPVPFSSFQVETFHERFLQQTPTLSKIQERKKWIDESINW
jgi:hypothetical protein